MVTRASGKASRILQLLSLFCARIALRSVTSGSALNFSAHTGARVAITARSVCASAIRLAALGLIKPKPYESTSIPAIAPPTAPQIAGLTHELSIAIPLSGWLGRNDSFSRFLPLQAYHGSSLHVLKEISPHGQAPMIEAINDPLRAAVDRERRRSRGDIRQQ